MLSVDNIAHCLNPTVLCMTSDQSLHVLLSSGIGYFPALSLVTILARTLAHCLATHSNKHFQIRPDHVLQRLLARAEHLHQEEVEEQQDKARPAGPGGGCARSHSQVGQISSRNDPTGSFVLCRIVQGVEERRKKKNDLEKKRQAGETTDSMSVFR